MDGNITQLLEAIERDTTRDERWEDGNKLADVLLTLASYYSSLTKPLAKAEDNEHCAERDFKLARERAKQERMSNKQSATAAETASILDVEFEHTTYLQYRYYARLLFLTRQSLDKTMDVGRSALTQMRSDKEGSRHAV